MRAGAVIVTAGPSYEPIDEVRRLTNFSTGELGVLLANRLAEEGWPVRLFLGCGATVRRPLDPRIALESFTTNDSLQQQLQAIEGDVAAFFHTAALCDFRVASIAGAEPGAAKLSSRDGHLTLSLAPAPKLLHGLRDLFPRARLAGWKYELNGAREDALPKARQQIRQSRSDLCILNGRAWGSGFGIVDPEGGIVEQPAKPELCAWLAQWLAAE